MSNKDIVTEIRFWLFLRIFGFVIIVFHEPIALTLGIDKWLSIVVASLIGAVSFGQVLTKLLEIK